MTEANATADTFVDFARDGLAFVLALAMVTIVLISSPGERRLLLGEPVDRGMRPRTGAARTRAGSLVVQPAGSASSTVLVVVIHEDRSGVAVLAE